VTIRPAELIERKRNGGELDADELSELVLAYARDGVPDYQMAAFCMAVWFRGLTSRETYALTDAMVRSGATMQLGDEIGRKVVDKHSTGGVGDKTTIAMAPVVAACGVPFAKMSGRGLGHTGGTLDKLESIPGFRTELDHRAFIDQVRSIGVAVIGQTDDLVPADKRLYALRDVTATVDSIPLIAASIMSKKLAAGADAIVLDVKVGDGAFTQTVDDARRLASTMQELGERAGREVVCVLTDMDQPLGHAVGNALEIREVIDLLRGGGPDDLRELVLAEAAHLLSLSDLEVDHTEGRRRAEEAIATGAALDSYERWIRTQGGDPDERHLASAPVVHAVRARESGAVTRLRARDVGQAALRLGAGRAAKHHTVDDAVGILLRVKRGDRVSEGEPLAQVHARDEASAAQAAEAVAAAYEMAAEPPPQRAIVLETIEP
jgi:pyrimidine-nucleoside phosphorylase